MNILELISSNFLFVGGAGSNSVSFLQFRL